MLLVIKQRIRANLHEAIKEIRCLFVDFYTAQNCAYSKTLCKETINYFRYS